MLQPPVILVASTGLTPDYQHLSYDHGILDVVLPMLSKEE